MKALVIDRLRSLLARLGFAMGRALPVRRRIVLATVHPAGIVGNLQFIRDELVGRQPAVPVVELVLRRRGGRRDRLAALPFAFRAGVHLATARAFVIDDYFFPMDLIRPRPGTFRVQVWHAAGAFKKMGYSKLDRSYGVDTGFGRRVPIHSNYDLVLVSSMSVAPHYAEAFRQPLSIFASRFGIPRTDGFFNPQRKSRAINRIIGQYGLLASRRVILYAPTFRGGGAVYPTFAEHMDLGLMRDVLGADHVLLLRLHPFIRQAFPISPLLADFVVDVSRDPNINELMLASDLLVTDYSSAMYEFALLGRPILFLAPDVEAYDREVGFYFDFRSGVPGPVFSTTAELAAFIRRGKFDTARVEAFARDSFDVTDGCSTQRLVDEVLLPALDGRYEVPPRQPSSLGDDR